ncbi:hypothetical protein Taro_016817 [Colocasia esculenta]|uniref:Uncharacterized protein n=1 Tax=Colocasia esculenta TaxID=4460 RepID=A0A843UU45_COLES|nr:hypothetical protein [Colocasia esculenta]
MDPRDPKSDPDPNLKSDSDQLF